MSEKTEETEAIYNGFVTRPHQSNPKSFLHCDLCVDISIYLINCLICSQHIFEAIRNNCSHLHGVIPTITNCPREATVVVNKGKANIVGMISQQWSRFTQILNSSNMNLSIYNLCLNIYFCLFNICVNLDHCWLISLTMFALPLLTTTVASLGQLVNQHRDHRVRRILGYSGVDESGIHCI